MNRYLPALLAAMFAAGSVPSHAHDLWIEPSRFRPQVGEAVELRVRVGENLVGDAVAFHAASVKRFFVEDAGGRRTFASRDGAEPAGRLHAVHAGTQVVGLYSGPYALELPAEKFTAYLREEGLESIVAQRRDSGQSDDPGREIFSRCAKSLVWVGPAAPAVGDRALGLPLELVALRNPHDSEQALPVRLTWRSRPLAGALVVAINSVDPTLKQSARSDADGRVHFRVDGPGTWLIKAVHMVLAPRGYDADWASWWASLTFEGRLGIGSR